VLQPAERNVARQRSAYSWLQSAEWVIVDADPGRKVPRIVEVFRTMFVEKPQPWPSVRVRPHPGAGWLPSCLTPNLAFIARSALPGGPGSCKGLRIHASPAQVFSQNGDFRPVRVVTIRQSERTSRNLFKRTEWQPWCRHRKHLACLAVDRSSRRVCVSCAGRTFRLACVANL
jgi:hypothetical protein